MSRGDLTGREWRILNPLLPVRGERGPAVRDRRRTADGILWVLRTGAPWRDVPERYGASSAYGMQSSRRWLLSGLPQTKTCHRFDDRVGAPACSRRKRGNQNQEALGRSRGGFSSKIHLRTNAKGDPLIFDVTGGEAHEVKGYDALMRPHEADPSNLLGDKGYDSDDIRRDLIDRGIEPVIPPRSNRKTPIKPAFAG